MYGDRTILIIVSSVRIYRLNTVLTGA